MALQVILADRDVTAQAAGLTFSNVDPGGYEACSFTLPSTITQPKPGERIRIMEGLTVAWEGVVEDPGPTQNHAVAQGQVQGVGYGVLLKDNPYQCIYVDRDQSRWTPMSTSRRLALINATLAVFDFTSRPDQTNGLPAIVTGLTGAWSQIAHSEAWYDAGPGNVIAALYYAFQATSNIGPADPGWTWTVYLAADDTASSYDSSGDLSAAASGSGYFTPGSARRYALMELVFGAAGGSDAITYELAWRNPAAYGNHGLTRRGSDPGGLFAEDIATHALTHTTGITRGVIDATGFTVAHSVYRDPTMPEQVIDDMAKLATVHWGVWENTSILADTPRLDFRARPTTPTCVVSRRDCDGLTITERRSQLYDECIVTYTDAAGTAGQVTVTAGNPRMPTGTTRTLGPLAMGIGSLGAAQDYAADALALAQASQRGGGSPTIPSTVLLPGGGSKPAHLLKAGLDRLKITDLPDSGSWTETDTRRFDAFRVKRVETSVDQGVAKTRVELDEGADLLEVLTARLAVDAIVTGA